MLVIGIDPGSTYTGYGIIRKENNRFFRTDSGRLKLSPKLALAEKLKEIYLTLSGKIEEHGPAEAALEKTFHSVNAHSTLVMSHARGAAMLACSMNDVPVYEYSPTQIKSSAAGSGAAKKEQVNKMVRIILGLRDEVPEDEADALAAAICHCGVARYESFPQARGARR